MITTRLRAALLGSGAAIALVAATAPGMANEMDEMRAQIQALQAKINTIEATTTSTRRVMPAAGTPIVSGVHKGYIIPGTKTSMRIGGYVKADFVYDFNTASGVGSGGGLAGAPSLAFKANATFAANGSARANQQNRFKFMSRQTRFNIRTWTPTDWGELATHIEVDFFGVAGTETITGSHTFRMRHAYGRLGPVLAGQTWTTYMDLWSIPETVDFFAVASESFVRQTMLRYTHNLGGGTTLLLALENPETLAARGGSKVAGATASPLLPVAVGTGPVTTDVDHVPDFILALVHVWKGVGRTPNRVKFSSVFRQLTIDNGGAAGGVGTGTAMADSAFGFGLHLGVRYWVTRNDQLQFSFDSGKGIGRYILGNISSGGAVINGDTAANFSLKAIVAWGGHIAWKHHWTDTIRTNIDLSRVQISRAKATSGGKASVVAGSAHIIQGSHVNVIWSPVKQVNIGLEYQWAKIYRYRSINSFDMSRIQVGFQYKF